MTAREQIEKAYKAIATGTYVRVLDIVYAIDVPTEEIEKAFSEMAREGWSIIANSCGGDVTADERKYCPTLGNHQVHLIKK